MKDFLIRQGIPFEGNYIKLPSFCKRIKIDIGTGGDAMHSKIWLGEEHNMLNDMVVFAFEPCKENVARIKDGSITDRKKIDVSHLGKDFFIINCALGNPGPNSVDLATLYIPENNDTEKCSINKIKKYSKKYDVPLYSLNHFLSFFHPSIIIEYIKINARGSDQSIIQGASRYMHRIAIITFNSYNVPIDNYDSDSDSDSEDNLRNNYYDTEGLLRLNHFEKDPPKILKSFNIDPTFYNKTLIDYINMKGITFYQIGFDD